MQKYFNPFIEEEQNLHSYVSGRRIAIIDALLFYVRNKSGTFLVYTKTGTGASFVISQVYKLLSAYENVFYLDGDKHQDVKEYFRNILELKNDATDNQIIEKLKIINVAGRHSILILEHIMSFNETDFMFLSEIIKECKNINKLFFGTEKVLNILSKNLKLKIVYKAKLKPFSVFESYEYLKDRFSSVAKGISLNEIIHKKAIFFIAFVCHGKPQILNKLAGDVLRDAIENKRFPIRFRYLIFYVMKFKKVTYPFFPIKWAWRFFFIILLLIAYLFYIPIERSFREYREEKIRAIIENDIRKTNDVDLNKDTKSLIVIKEIDEKSEIKE